ncbi:hypothetical protein GH5_04744 [Leishmania sp. Ghana 2012 LV757]|uniref:hypothetical protein n=1 Tax=Leishmania sp. Ghana 2012 LV757 TaxID=2803181 RepID=UPI001B5465C6|nr:hypothetical protein GH5_04744 [Leishmania sp. Ghana 2012 LV757]
MGGDFCTVPGMLSEPLPVQAGCRANGAVAGRRAFLCLVRGHTAASARCESLAHHSASFQLAVERCPTATPPLTSTPPPGHRTRSLPPAHPPVCVCACAAPRCPLSPPSFSADAPLHPELLCTGFDLWG